MSLYQNYQEWREDITTKGGFTLDRAYCEERIAALQNDEEPSTRSFLDAYGDKNRQQIIAWFQQALSEQ